MAQKHIRKAAIETTQHSVGFDFSSADLLNMLGLQGAEFRARNVRRADGFSYLTLGDGKWDERSGGAVAIKTRAGLDRDNRLRRLEVDYLSLQPSGFSKIDRLCELETRVSGPRLRIGKFDFLGDAVDAENQEQIARIMGALQRIHADIRNFQFPEIARVFHDFQLAGIRGRRIDLAGSSPQGGLNFTVPINQTDTATPFLLPRDFVQELIGNGANDFDPIRNLGKQRDQIGANPRGGELFRCIAELTAERTVGNYRASTKPLSAQTGVVAPDLFTLSWRTANDNPDHVLIDQFLLRGDESHGLHPALRQQRLGVVNLATKDLRAGRYPAVPDHLAKYKQHSLTAERSLGLDLDGLPQMAVIPVCGHNDREYMPGFGGTIGGNCKVILAMRRDEAGRVRRKGVIVDFGIVFSKKNGIQAGEHGTFDYVMPDISNFDEDCDHICITHLHADHMQGIVDLANCGKASAKTVHLSVYDCRVLIQFLKKSKVPEDQWPKMNSLQGEGWIHIEDGGEKVMSVFYSTNAIPHSTNVVAYGIAPAPHYGGKANPHYWSYASFGDMSFGPYNLPDYQGDMPADTGFKRDFFKNFKEGMWSEYPGLPPAMRKKINLIGVAEIDPTSIHREGFAPDIVTVQPNWVRFNSWFKDKGIVVPNLSTAKRAQEMMFRIAVETGRNISSEGAYLQDRFRDMNVEGVNIDVLPKDPDGGNIQNYIDWYAGLKGMENVFHLGRTSELWKEIVRESPQHTLILATGSQGSEIEKDSVGTQIAEGRSRFHLDPKYCRAAYGVDPKDFVYTYAQGAIPGHEDEQLAQIRKTAFDNDLMVGVAMHNGTRFFNLKEPYISRIVQDLETSGDRYTIEENGGLFIHGISLYVPGHGWKEDYRQGFIPWFKDNDVQSVWVQHFSRNESVRIAYGLADEAGLDHPAEPTPNHAVCTRKYGTDFQITSHETPSFILARNNRRADEYHGGTTEYKRVVFRVDENQMADGGLFAANENTIFYEDFGSTPFERAKREALLPPVRSRRRFDPAMTRRGFRVDKREHFPTRGPVNPLQRPTPRHILLAGVR